MPRVSSQSHSPTSLCFLTITLIAKVPCSVEVLKMPLFLPFMLRNRPIVSTACRARLFSSSTDNGRRSLAEVGPLACQIKSRAVIRFEGPDTIKFLQGLLTNDVRSLGNQNSTEYVPTPNVALAGSSPVYSAMLTSQGRFLYDLFLYRPARPREMLDRTGSGPGSDGASSDNVIYADVGADVLDELLNCFKKYRLRSKVEIENVAAQFSCWQRFGGNLSGESTPEKEPEAAAIGWGGGTDRTAESSARGNNFGWQWYSDPRVAFLGFRGIFPSDTVPPLVEADKEVDEEYYLLWRLEKGIAEGSVEIPKGDAIPHEYNLTGLNAISFSKGCYVGQELVARTHHRGVIRKRLVPLKFTNETGEEVEQKVAPGAEVVEATSRKKAGNVSAALGSRGMGVLRLEDAFKSSLIINDQPEVKVKVARPEWWPAEWTHEVEQRTATV